MTYQVLARKWRPRNFASLVGQEHVVKALNHALTEQRLHHAYLFTGTRGVGKTTIARILAKSLNCETGITAHPCGHCSACLEIDAGRFVDLLEVDAATNTRVEEMRQLLENAVYAPTRGRFKVYVIDEVHMLSNSAFNAMLKTLEEPPEHVKFILATTDPQKIPVTVLSRCLQFNLKQMVPAAIAEYLAHILNAEAVPYELAALGVIAKAAAGSMRDGLSLLDQAIAHGAGHVEAAQVRQMLGSVDGDVVLRLLERWVNQDLAGLLDDCQQLALESCAFQTVLQEMAARLTEVQMLQLLPAGAQHLDLLDAPRLQHLATALNAQSVQLAYQIVVQGRKDLVLAPDELSGFQMVMMRLFAFAPASPVQPLDIPPLGQGFKAVSANRQPAPPAQTVTVATEESPVSVAPKSSSTLLETEASQVPEGGDVSWASILTRLSLTGMARNLAANCELRTWGDGVCVLRLGPAQKHLLLKAAQDKLQGALVEYQGKPVRLSIELAENEALTPALAEAEATRERLATAQSAIESDGFVRFAQEEMGAEIVPNSIRPNGS